MKAVRELKEPVEKRQQKEDQGERKGRKVAKRYVFPRWLGSEDKLANAMGAEPNVV